MVDLAYVIVSLFVVLVNIVPLCWQIEHRNSGPICLIFWVIVLNLLFFVSRCPARKDLAVTI